MRPCCLPSRPCWPSDVSEPARPTHEFRNFARVGRHRLPKCVPKYVSMGRSAESVEPEIPSGLCQHSRGGGVVLPVPAACSQPASETDRTHVPRRLSVLIRYLANSLAQRTRSKFHPTNHTSHPAPPPFCPSVFEKRWTTLPRPRSHRQWSDGDPRGNRKWRHAPLTSDDRSPIRAYTTAPTRHGRSCTSSPSTASLAASPAFRHSVTTVPRGFALYEPTPPLSTALFVAASHALLTDSSIHSLRTRPWNSVSPQSSSPPPMTYFQLAQ